MEENNDYIYGIHPVQEALNNPQTGVEKIYLRQNMRGAPVNRITEAASARKVPVLNVPGSKLNELVGRVNDQGVVALLSGITYTELEPWLEQAELSAHPFVVVLSEIEDTHNFGAILRSSAAAGAAAVIVPKHRQAPVNATVFKTSAGTAGKIPIIRVTNLNQAIGTLKDAGFWFAGLSAGADRTIWEESYNAPMGIVIGSEGSGIRQKTAELCDFLLSVPMHNGVESLNASVSAALVLFEINRRRQPGTKP
ncbi:MAG: 23S rRNA (guanosine(2251)-2'-O)-methyltransferase RlmB [Candidatus Cyclonatronum sp.]|uniref:23S rRNA (guanosine(2251)-2'-O)-methyltransferase RlmB n=1 Tax=Cyclonatronum sp. TaxID=3024185 RepID=UPI0025C40AAE|nr:23S rRNA (guanosine(2251)-2'-O)-methyltransferase RlmB [Cyclonatronum sp.]MCC5932839.1 23S rRNA (guanosine(2251)-2'-O)-methyltransferase RlmB [Balneolales bacterium]MCH8485629.1 23S rRNA (guanosine(2251)-2'-O)-methyltransferase RlmB [Cyclonatronum sp.]